MLYTTTSCHLCEQAEALLSPFLEREQLRLETVEITQSAALVDRYGSRIPVLGIGGRSGELDWPFDAGQLAVFIAETAIRQS
ncbi:MAG: glutaredoxin family protein [Pseudomonadales bacterium]|nr:glutaredoxin family protein [Pseudomonadales bacterium]